MVFALAGDSTITSGLGNGGTSGIRPVSLHPGASARPNRRVSGGGKERKWCHAAWRPVKPQRERPHPGTARGKVYSRAVLGTILGLLPGPKQIIENASPFGELLVMAIIFAETGLLIGFFLPGDSLLFTAGLLANQGDLNIAFLLVGVFAAAVIGDQVGYQFGRKAGP